MPLCTARSGAHAEHHRRWHIPRTSRLGARRELLGWCQVDGGIDGRWGWIWRRPRTRTRSPEPSFWHRDVSDSRYRLDATKAVQSRLTEVRRCRHVQQNNTPMTSSARLTQVPLPRSAALTISR